MTYFVYIAECADGTLYTGITTDVERRMEEHNGERKGGAKYTAGRRPVKLAYFAEFDNRSETAKEERRIKKLPKTEKRKLTVQF